MTLYSEIEKKKKDAANSYIYIYTSHIHLCINDWKCVLLARMQKPTIKSITLRYGAINRQNNEHCDAHSIHIYDLNVTGKWKKDEKSKANQTKAEEKANP